MFGAHPQHQFAARDPFAHLGRGDGLARQGHDGIARGKAAFEGQEIHRRRADEIGDKQRGRVIIDFLRCAELFHNTMIHHDNLVAHLHRFQLVMGHIDSGGPHPVMQGAQFFGHVFAKLGIERAQGFVHHKGLGIADDGAAQGDALPVAAGQATDGFVEDRCDAQDACHLGHLGLYLGAGYPLRNKRIADVPPHVHVRVEGEHLEHHGDVALAGGFLADILTVDQDLARGGQFQPGYHPQGGGLAAARRPQQHEKLAMPDGEGRFLDRDESPKFFPKVADDDLGQFTTPGNARR